MQIRVGYELIYYCPQPTPMILTLNVHYTRASDLVVPDHLTDALDQICKVWRLADKQPAYRRLSALARR